MPPPEDRKPAAMGVQNLEDSDHEGPRTKQKTPAPTVVSLAGNSAHPMFLGSQISPELLEAVKELMNPTPVAKNPSFYGSAPLVGMKKEFGSVISPSMLGAAETFAESNHPIYADVAASCAQRMPESVWRNMRAGQA